MRHNHRCQAYIPRVDLILLLFREMMRQIIEEDATIPASDKRSFADRIMSRASILQGLFIYTGLPMLYLKELVEANFSDRDLPIGRHLGPKLDGYNWGHEISSLLTNQWIFCAYKFPVPGNRGGPWHVEIHNEIVVPILFKATDDANGKSDAIGKGPSSIVYKARIDPVHHYFTQVSLKPKFD